MVAVAVAAQDQAGERKEVVEMWLAEQGLRTDREHAKNTKGQTNRKTSVVSKTRPKTGA